MNNAVKVNQNQNAKGLIRDVREKKKSELKGGKKSWTEKKQTCLN